MSFQELKLIQPILQAVADAGYSNPTAIQHRAIPHILKGEDVLGCAQTGTGKTAAFAIPILQRLSVVTPLKRSIRTLILTPTRELAIQIEDSFKAYGKHLRLKCCAIFGGVPQGKQVTNIRNGVDILIATPGRLLDLMGQGILSLNDVEIFVLDEADRMLDMGFISDIKKILPKLPRKRQTLFFSATMPDDIKAFAGTMQQHPVEVAVTPISATADTVRQSVYFVEKKRKTGLLISLLKEGNIQRSLVFTRTKHGADRLVKQLSKSGLHSAAIHGNKSQAARQKALAEFKDSRIRVLVATDIAARGIDIDELPHVVNYELPHVAETYVHRIGRTGRAGLGGTAVSFCDTEEMADLKSIQKLIGFKVPVAGDLLKETVD